MHSRDVISHAKRTLTGRTDITEDEASDVQRVASQSLTIKSAVVAETLTSAVPTSAATRCAQHRTDTR